MNLNGVTLVAGTDYNTSTANTIAGLSALTASDVVEIVVYDVFSVFSGNVNSDFSVGGNLTVTGTVDITVPPRQMGSPMLVTFLQTVAQLS